MRRLLFILSYLITLVCVSAQPSETNRKMNVLMIGNSYVQGSKSTVHEFLNADLKVSALVRGCASGGWSLSQHVNDKEERLKRALEEGVDGVPYDVITLLEKTSSTKSLAQDPKASSSFVTNAKTISEWARKANPNARIICFVNWPYAPEHQVYQGSYKDPKDMLDSLTLAYERLATLIQAEVAPIGKAWYSLLDSKEPMKLYAHDGKHAGSLGNLVIASVLYGVICSRNPVENPYTSDKVDSGDLLEIKQAAAKSLGY